MSTIRTFIAVAVGSGVRERACDLIERFRQTGVKASWTKPPNMHLTLKFLGDMPESQVPDVCRAVTDAARAVAPFRLEFVGAGAFPSVQRPSTLWIGVAEGKTEVCALAERLDAALEPLGIRRESRRFTPHLTLGRVRKGGPLGELSQALQSHAGFAAGAAPIGEVLIFASYLDPGGVTHQVLGRAPLAG